MNHPSKQAVHEIPPHSRIGDLGVKQSRDQAHGSKLASEVGKHRQSADRHLKETTEITACRATKPRRQQLSKHQRCRSMNLSLKALDLNSKDGPSARPSRPEQHPHATARQTKPVGKTRSSPQLLREKLAGGQTPQGAAKKPVLRVRRGATPLASNERLTKQGNYVFRNPRPTSPVRASREVRDVAERTRSPSKPLPHSPQGSTLLQTAHMVRHTNEITAYLNQHRYGNPEGGPGGARASQHPPDDDRIPRQRRRSSSSSDHETTHAPQDMLNMPSDRRDDSRERETTAEESLQSTT